MPLLNHMDCIVCGFVHEGSSNCPACGSEPIQTPSPIDSNGNGIKNVERNEKNVEDIYNEVNIEVSKDDSEVIATDTRIPFGIGDAPTDSTVELEIFGLDHSPSVDLKSPDRE